MEIYGMMYAAHNCSEPRPLAVAVKCVTDQANPKKNDDVQPYGAFASAYFLRELLFQIPF
jgi:hypothetical protein